jgi:hypothetical protein
MDDQLILGIKGTLSVVELGVLRMRLKDGRDAKAARGELKHRLPPGYTYDAVDRPVKHPDSRIREAVELVFEKFGEFRVGRQLYVWFHDESIEMPVYQFSGGKLTLKWRVPTEQYLTGIIKNPFYAGAYVYGRRPQESMVRDGRVVKRTSKLRSPKDCQVFIPDHHEAYIPWETFEQNVASLAKNAARTRSRDSVTAPRKGVGLLVGLIRCGHCGRRLQVNYWGRHGTTPRYICRGTIGEPSPGCLSFSGGLVERALEQQLLAALSPLGIEASLVARNRLIEGSAGKLRMLEQRVDQLRYEARRAFEQYDEVDPRNRLVATDLERRWNERLVALEAAEVDLEEARRPSNAFGEHTLERLEQLGARFEEAWSSKRCPAELKKKIVQAAIHEVLVRRDGQHLIFVIHWAGGAHTELRVHQPPASSVHKTSSDALRIIEQLAPKYDDATIAGILSIHGLRTGKGNRWNKARVFSARRRHNIHPNCISPQARGLLNVKQAVAHCSVSRHVVHRLIDLGWLRNEQTVDRAPLEIPVADLDSSDVRQVIDRFRRTGRLDAKGGEQNRQAVLFEENQGDVNAR